MLLLFVGVSVGYLVLNETRSQDDLEVIAGETFDQGESSETNIGGRDAVSEAGNPDVIVYYFHGNTRCRTCRTIEAYTEEAVKTSFPDDLKSGRLEWRVVNMETPGNEHFVKDYELYTRSVVLVDMEDGVEEKWDNLEKVWELVQNKPDFVDYIVTNTNTYLAVENE